MASIDQQIVTGRIIISPYGDSVGIADMERIFDRAGAANETVFRRLEFNQVISYTRGVGIDIGCGLSKVHSAAIGIDFQLGTKDFGYPFGANIKVHKNNHSLYFPWFSSESLDFVFTSHCLEHFSHPEIIIEESFRVLKAGGFLVIVLPDTRFYPVRGSSAANPDHEWDPYPEVLMDIVNKAAQFKLIMLDTIHNILKNVELTERDRTIAQQYGHESLNFSFEGIFQKV